ncbi:uncharacterized protein M6D78_016043 [Vipera latastei]
MTGISDRVCPEKAPYSADGKCPKPDLKDPELAALRDFLDKNLARGFIHPSSSPVQAKSVMGALPRLLQPLLTPKRPSGAVSMDFLMDLPPSSGFMMVFVVVDMLTKMAHFIPCRGLPSARTTCMFIQRRFEDPLADRKARERIKTVRQGRRTVAEYTQEFRAIASKLNWPEDILLSHFKDGLNYDLYDACLPRGDPYHLDDWYVLAEEVEIDLLKRQRRGKPWGRPPLEQTCEGENPPATAKKSKGCFNCGREGHRAAECRSKAPPRKTEAPSSKKLGKSQGNPKESSMKGTEAVESTISAKTWDWTPAYTAGAVDTSEDSSEGEPLMDTSFF